MLIDSSYKTIAEALLFISNEPLSLEALAEVLNIDEASVRQVVETLAQDYQNSNRGIMLREVGGGYELATVPEADPFIKKMFSVRKANLSDAAYEVLAIIAYRQPVTRSQIESIRGVKSDGPLQQLLLRGLIEEKGRLEQPGRPIVYGTTIGFLTSFGLKDLSELPDYETYHTYKFTLPDENPQHSED